MAQHLGAAAHHIFLLVPTGRAKEMADQAISPWTTKRRSTGSTRRACLPDPAQGDLRAALLPDLHQRKKERAQKALPENPLHAMTRGCLGGSSFCFISHRGQVQPCGYLELDCGQLKEKPFEKIWKESPIFRDLRDLGKYGGKCGRCEFIRVCGGCRARAYEKTGDYLAEEPLCIYEPKGSRHQASGSRLQAGKKKNLEHMPRESPNAGSFDEIDETDEIDEMDEWIARF